MPKKTKKGFTLIELLVVVSIISLLSSIILSSLNSARAKGRDARRKSDLHQLQLALDLYLDSYSSLPEIIGLDTSIGCAYAPPSCSAAFPPSPIGSDWVAGSDLRALVTAGLISKIPVDPVNNSTYFYYYEVSGGNSYCLRAVLETNPVSYFYARGGPGTWQNPLTGTDFTCP